MRISDWSSDVCSSDLGVSLALAPNRACYVPVGHGGSDMFAEKPVQLDRALVLAKLKPRLEAARVLKIGHNSNSQPPFFAPPGYAIPPLAATFLIGFVLTAGLQAQNRRTKVAPPALNTHSLSRLLLV